MGVTLVGGSLGGLSVNNGRSIRATFVRKRGQKYMPSASSSRWLMCAVDGVVLKMVELEVYTRDSSLYVQAISAGYKLVGSGWQGDFETEANSPPSTISETPVA